MTASLFQITPTPPTAITLAPGQEGKFSFTVQSLAAPDKVHGAIVQALLVGDDGKGKEVDWLTAGPLRALTMTGGQTQTVTITARPTAGTPRAQHRIRLLVADRDLPNELFTDSPPVICEVVPPAVPPPPPPKRPWWLIPAIAGGVVLLAGVVVLIVKLAGADHGLGAPCDSTAACDQGLFCVSGIQRCLLAGGAACDPAHADQCATGECAGNPTRCSIPLGAACAIRMVDPVPCTKNGVCNPKTNTCLGNPGAPCKIGADCTSGLCTSNLCVAAGGGFAVVLKSGGTNVISVIKVIREFTGLGLAEAKALVDGAPKTVKTGITQNEARDIAKQLTAAGATIEIQEIQ